MTRALVMVALFAGLAGTASADTILNFQTPLGDYYARLYDTVAPLTTANFVSYVADESLYETIVHRVDTDISIIQLGQIAFYDTPGMYYVTPKAPIPLEYHLPNVRGSLSMARTTALDSATSEWFVNLADNTNVLGQSNGGGYAVFGQVMRNGMSVVDAIYALPSYYWDVTGFELPLNGYNPALGADKSNFVTHIPTVVAHPGDANNDGITDLSDLGILAGSYGKSGMGWNQGDFNNDGTVDLSDLGILAGSYGKDFLAEPAPAGQVPEPATMSLLAAGAVTLLRRRRKSC